MNEGVSEDVRERLRRQLRVAAPAEGAPAPREALPAWFRARAGRAAAATDAPPADATDGVDADRAAPRELAEVATPFGAHAVRIARRPAGARHGAWRLDEALDASAADLALVARDRALAGFDARSALFLDIETTGLSGGAGTHVFLVGLAWFEDGELVAWQGFARGPEEEASLLHDCAQRIARAQCLVTFFGKSFDRHRLEDKMQQHGIPAPFAGRAHLDLYHPCRRLYGDAFEDGRLATLERGLCGVAREHDLAGSFAPAAWFDFLAGRPHRLEQVFRHNADDVASLVVLCAHVGRSLGGARADGAELGGPERERRRGLARLFVRERRYAEALEHLERAGVEDGERARLLERVGRAHESLALWRRLGEAGRDAPAARALCEAARLALRLGADDAAALHARAVTLVPATLAGTELARRVSTLLRLGRRLTPR